MPAWLFILVLAVLLVLANVVFWAAGLWCMGRLWRSPALPLRRLLGVCMIWVILDYGLMYGLRPLGDDVRNPTVLLFSLATVAYFIVSRVWVARRFLDRRLPRAVLLALGALVIQMVLLFAAVTPIRRTVCEVFVVPSPSMAPTLPQGGRLLIDRTLAPARWDIVMYRAPRQTNLYFVKRVVGLPGERVDVLPDRILIDGAEVPLPAPLRGARFHPVPARAGAWVPEVNSPAILGPDEYYVIGDNTQQSSDSRFVKESAAPGRAPGLVPASDIVGVGRLLYRPTLRFFR